MITMFSSILLGATMCLAGGTKIASGSRWPAEAVALGTPSVVVPFIAWFEILLGALLIVHIAPRVTGTIAALLLVMFTTLILRKLAAGERPICACFGTWSTRPLGWRHVLRNIFLITLAVITLTN